MATIFKTLVGSIASGNTSIIFTDENINNDSLIDVYFSNSEIDYNISQVNNSVTVEIEKQSSVTGVALFINNSDSVDYPITADSVSYGTSDVDTVLGALNRSTEELGQSVVAHGVAIQQLDTNKQDTLIPGDNITIENNVISASGGGSDIIPSGIIQITSIYEGGNNDDYTYTVLEDGYYVAIVRLSAQSTGNAAITINDTMSLYNVGNQNRLTGVHVSSGLLHLSTGCTIRVVGAFCAIYKYNF